MIKFENTEVIGWEAAIRGMRNPKNSWEKSDSCFEKCRECSKMMSCDIADDNDYHIGSTDIDLMRRLAAGGKVGTVANSCSTMHKIAAKKFTLEDFSCEHLCPSARSNLGDTIHLLNCYRHIYNNWDDLKDNTAPGLCGITSKKDAWRNMIQLLPSSYN